MDRRPNRLLAFALAIVTLPVAILYVWLVIDSISVTGANGFWPERFTLRNWRFLVTTIEGHPSIWPVTFNTLVFAASTVAIVVALSATAGYALSRLDFPFRRHFLGAVLVLHAFPSVTLLVAIFLTLRMLGLYDTLLGVILVKATLELPLGIWVMKGFYDSVPWEIEMAGLQDGAGRLQVWYRLVLPQIVPGATALAVFSFIAGWSEYILPLVLAPSADVQILSVYLAGLTQDDYLSDFGLFKAVGLFYILPVLVFYLCAQNRLMQIYASAPKG